MSGTYSYVIFLFNIHVYHDNVFSFVTLFVLYLTGEEFQFVSINDFSLIRNLIIAEFILSFLPTKSL